MWGREDHANDEHVRQRNGDGKDDCAKEIHEDDELHAEAECPAEVANEDEFHQVVDRGVDPSTTLRKEDAERIRDYSSALRLRKEHHLAVGECAEEDRGEEAIFPEQ